MSIIGAWLLARPVSGSVLQIHRQPFRHPDRSPGKVGRARNFYRDEVAAIDAVLQRVKRLGGRANGDVNELPERPRTKAAEAFGDVSWNRRSRLTNLSTESEVARGRTLGYQAINLYLQGISEPPGLQIFERFALPYLAGDAHRRPISLPTLVAPLFART